jgi:ATP-dependent DNA helicase RecG
MKDTLKGTQKTIVEIVISNPNVTIPEVARQLNLNPRGIAKHFKVLQDKGVIRRVGPDKGGHWEVIE